MTSIAVIGGGKIGEALIAGLIDGGVDPKDIHVTTRTEQRSDYLRDTYSVLPFAENSMAVDGVDIVFLCVKPYATVKVVEEISRAIDHNDATTVVSMAAGITTNALEDALAAGAPVIRAMPNTPMLVGKGMIALAPGRFVDAEQLERVVALLQSTGAVRVVAEADMNAVTALSGSSPAYFFLMVEAMIDAGISLGLNREAAKDLCVNAIHGAAAMLTETGEEPAVLRANITSPGGSTIAAIREFEESGLRAAVYRATEACAKRAEELG